MEHYMVRIPGSEYFLDDGNRGRHSHVIEVSVADSELAHVDGDEGYSRAEHDAIGFGDARLVDVTVSVFRIVLGQRIPKHLEVAYGEVYGFVDGHRVAPETHPQTPWIVSVALEGMMKR